jgi:hypothetical protein
MDIRTISGTDDYGNSYLHAQGVPGDPQEPGVPVQPQEPGEPTIPDQPPPAPVA